MPDVSWSPPDVSLTWSQLFGRGGSWSEYGGELDVTFPPVPGQHGVWSENVPWSDPTRLWGGSPVATEPPPVVDPPPTQEGGGSPDSLPLPSYVFYVVDAMTGQIHERLALNGWSYGKILNGVGEMEGSIARDDPHATVDVFRETENLLVVERDGLIVWDGILWSWEPNDEDSFVLHGAEMWSYLHRLLVREDLKYVNWDMMRIAQNLVRRALDRPQAIPTIGVPVKTSGVLRSLTLKAQERKTIASVVEEMTKADDGFDFTLEGFWQGRELRHTFETYYPRRGTGIVWPMEFGGNVAKWDGPIDGTTRAQIVDVVGTGTGDKARVRTSPADGTFEGRGPRLELAFSADTTAQGTGLAAMAVQLRRIARLRFPKLTLTLSPGAAPLPHELTLGDTMRVRIDDGPVQIDGRYRAVEMHVSETDGGSEEMIVECVHAEAYRTFV